MDVSPNRYTRIIILKQGGHSYFTLLAGMAGNLTSFDTM